MNSYGERLLRAGRRPRPQTPACDRCSVGVMDIENQHLWGDCDCPCHRTAAGTDEVLWLGVQRNEDGEFERFVRRPVRELGS